MAKKRYSLGVARGLVAIEKVAKGKYIVIETCGITGEKYRTTNMSWQYAIRLRQVIINRLVNEGIEI